ncbi:MAG: 16S rRNA (adenine(1518)-N(6)/adenine(1519)-N(6))-dimethyltransferase RsmA [Bacteroidota bacterium]
MSKIHPKKSLGQHFLHEQGVIQKIVDAVTVPQGGRVIEIGPGTGALTGELIHRFARVTAIEIDRRVISELRKQYPELDVIQEDVLKVDWDRLLTDHEPVTVVGNLPYYITSQILFSILEQRNRLTSAVIMMQKEVAARLVSPIGTKAYGILSVQTQLMSEPELLFDVAPGAFTPPPGVTSSVVRLTFNKPPLACTDRSLKRVVRTAFQQRRKKLSNSLAPLGTMPEDPAFDYSLRAERWKPSLYEKLTARLEQDGTIA